jgi:hypothetical protein
VLQRVVLALAIRIRQRPGFAFGSFEHELRLHTRFAQDIIDSPTDSAKCALLPTRSDRKSSEQRDKTYAYGDESGHHRCAPLGEPKSRTRRAVGLDAHAVRRTIGDTVAAPWGGLALLLIDLGCSGLVFRVMCA